MFLKTLGSSQMLLDTILGDVYGFNKPRGVLLNLLEKIKRSAKRS